MCHLNSFQSLSSFPLINTIVFSLHNESDIGEEHYEGLLSFASLSSVFMQFPEILWSILFFFVVLPDGYPQCIAAATASNRALRKALKLPPQHNLLKTVDYIAKMAFKNFPWNSHWRDVLYQTTWTLLLDNSDFEKVSLALVMWSEGTREGWVKFAFSVG